MISKGEEEEVVEGGGVSETGGRWRKVMEGQVALMAVTY